MQPCIFRVARKQDSPQFSNDLALKIDIDLLMIELQNKSHISNYRSLFEFNPPSLETNPPVIKVCVVGEGFFYKLPTHSIYYNGLVQ